MHKQFLRRPKKEVADNEAGGEKMVNQFSSDTIKQLINHDFVQEQHNK